MCRKAQGSTGSLNNSRALHFWIQHVALQQCKEGQWDDLGYQKASTCRLCLEMAWVDGEMQWKWNGRKRNGGNHEWYRYGSPSWWLWEVTKTHQVRIRCVNSSLHGPQMQFILSFPIGIAIAASSFTYTPAERYASQLLPWLLQGGTHLLNTPRKQPCALFINQKECEGRTTETKRTAWSSTLQQQAEFSRDSACSAIGAPHNKTKNTLLVSLGRHHVRCSWLLRGASQVFETAKPPHHVHIHEQMCDGFSLCSLIPIMHRLAAGTQCSSCL